MTVSALMPVHAGVAPEHLAEALASLLAQTRPPDEIVVVEDGPLDEGHRAVLEDLERRHPRVVAVRLATNGGAGLANQAGLEAATGEWIAKVDADDVSEPGRLEAQLAAVHREGADLCGAAMLEFDSDTGAVTSLRSAPLTHERIGRRMRSNNPVNHPTAFYRRTLALEAGGYPPWRFMQDYGLMARIYAAGGRMMNLPEPLVRFRAGGSVTRRRRSATIRRLEPVLQRELRDLGLIGTPRLVVNLGWRTAFRLLPARGVLLVSQRVLARPVEDAARDRP